MLRSLEPCNERLQENASVLIIRGVATLVETLEGASDISRQMMSLPMSLIQELSRSNDKKAPGTSWGVQPENLLVMRLARVDLQLAR